MRYILRTAVVQAEKIVSVGIGAVAGVSQPHMTLIRLENGETLSLSTTDLRYGTPQVGDYWLPEPRKFKHKGDFEGKYIAQEVIPDGAADGEQQAKDSVG